MTEDYKEAIQNALYATQSLTPVECENITEGILQYIKESGFEIIKTPTSPIDSKEGAEEPDDAIDYFLKPYASLSNSEVENDGKETAINFYMWCNNLRDKKEAERTFNVYQNYRHKNQLPKPPKQ